MMFSLRKCFLSLLWIFFEMDCLANRCQSRRVPRLKLLSLGFWLPSIFLCLLVSLGIYQLRLVVLLVGIDKAGPLIRKGFFLLFFILILIWLHALVNCELCGLMHSGIRRWVLNDSSVLVVLINFLLAFLDGGILEYLWKWWLPKRRCGLVSILSPPTAEAHYCFVDRHLLGGQVDGCAHTLAASFLRWRLWGFVQAVLFSINQLLERR